jgi:hypothetical protein
MVGKFFLALMHVIHPCYDMAGFKRTGDIKGLKNPDLLVISPALFHITELDAALKSICLSLQTENN